MNVRMLAIAATLVMLWGTATAADSPDSSASSVTSTPTAEAAEAPGALLPQLNFEFDPVVDGAQVTHDFPIKNTGTGLLAISNVKTG